jgi:hypothetical protein
MTTFTKPVLRELRNQLDAILNSNGIDDYTAKKYFGIVAEVS